MDDLDRVIEAIEHDTVSGSSTLADRLILALINLEPQLTPNDKLIILKKIKELSVRRPFFAVLKHLGETLNESNKNWSTLLREYKDNYDRMSLKISEQLLFLTGPHPKVFLLHSHSKTIVSAFEVMAAEKVNAKIFQTYSNPEKEGVIQAEKLQDLGFDVTLIDDDPSQSTLVDVDYFVTGADLILPTNFINKSGTERIAQKIIQAGKQYFVLADERKFSTMDVKELPSAFERISRTLITKLVTGK